MVSLNKMKKNAIVEEIGILKPDILVVALGAPYAERWIHKNKSKLNAKRKSDHFQRLKYEKLRRVM
ncbi:WecB/TagA/CpsF family glycosyltransferase [Paenibacillus artemisiicola]|uniref:WecB/TagA/CpsF family glycosyltransferase n=1 Tax=Paenibacillus artemisiicola TaxID=1172618 RepID=UPI001F0B0AC3|nr:WecB/TagA/CpsF family glycosyltransferase [Paenibacillus artemisiicola]